MFAARGGFASGGNYFNAIGGTITVAKISNVVYKIHTFTSNGNFTVLNPNTGSSLANVQLLITGGGGAGGAGTSTAGGGGGGGSAIWITPTPVIGVFGNTSYPLVVGLGGNSNSANGGTSTAFGGYFAVGGFGGALGPSSLPINGGSATAGNTSGSPGGGGGLQYTGVGNCAGTGGGGYLDTGNPITITLKVDGTLGGNSFPSTFNGSFIQYSGGGGGGASTGGGGGGGGGDAGTGGNPGVAGDNAGGRGAGGGGGGINSAGGTGSDGLIVIRYPL